MTARDGAVSVTNKRGQRTDGWHQHEGSAICKPRLKHWCRCPAPKAFECQKCSRDRFNREAAELYRASLSVEQLLERQA